MSLHDDLEQTAVTAATLALAAHLPEIPAARLEPAATAALGAARAYLDGTELARCLATHPENMKVDQQKARPSAASNDPAFRPSREAPQP